jgi:hypothetical protein
MFAALSAGAYFVAVIGGDALLRSRFRPSEENPVVEAVQQVGVEPVAYLLMAIPFVALHGLAVYIARRSTIAKGVAASIVVAIVTSIIFFAAYEEYYKLLEARKWTAAAFPRLSAIVYSLGAIAIATVCAVHAANQRKGA